MKKKNLSLVLSGGSALGLAHLGAIEYFEENNFKFKEIIGTSMGALVGAVYAKENNFLKTIELFEDENFFKYFKPKLISSLIDDKKIKSKLDEIFQDKTFKDLPIDLKVIATREDTGEVEVFDKNNDTFISDALCASIALPGLFPPHKINNKFYWDGFLSSNLPVEFSNYNTIAVDVINTKLLGELSSFKISSAVRKGFLITILNQTREKIENHSLEKKVDIDTTPHKLYDFHKVKELKKIGYNETLKQMKDTSSVSSK